VAKRFGLGEQRITPGQWQKVNDAVDTWKGDVLRAARLLPAQAYKRGRTQTMRFLHLLGASEQTSAAADRATINWLNWTLEHELTGTLDRYIDEIRSAVLYGLQANAAPEIIASRLQHATGAADRDWRLVAQTEMARANALGRLDGSLQMGYDEVWIPPHTGACEACKALIENRVFPIEQLRAGSNFGKKRSDWEPCLPLHPRCRHTSVPWVPAVYQEAQDEYAHMRELGLDDDTLAAMFDSSGQLRPQYDGDDRLAALFAGKTIGDPFEHILGQVVRKVRSSGTVTKGFFDPPQAGLDPLIWQNEQLKPDVRDAIIDFWTGVLGAGWRDWAHVYITGSATSYQWGTGWQHPWLGSHQTQTFPDVDTHLVIDYPAVRVARPLWAGMTPMELRKLLEAWAKKAKDEVEVAPGLRLDAYIRMEETEDEFERDVARTGQGVWDVTRGSWVIQPSEHPAGEYVRDGRILGGVGGRLVHENPDWIKRADETSAHLQTLLDIYTANPGPGTLAELQGYMDALYDARTAGFLEGAGQEDRGNWTWQYLENFGPLLDVKALLIREAA
jgi:hypothetical protein